MQHDEQYWQDAEAFKPERWIGDKTGGDKSGGMAYMPFGLGPRMCIGIKLACKWLLHTLSCRWTLQTGCSQVHWQQACTQARMGRV